METDQRQAEPVEIELKLLFPPNRRAAIDAHPALSSSDGPVRTERLVATYFDTPDLTLAGHRCAVRVRRNADGYVQTVKSPGAAEGVAETRGEWEWPVPDDQLDPSLIAGTAAGAFLTEQDKRRLCPVFTTDVQRSTRLIRLEDGAVVEVAIDQGALRAGTAEAPVGEIELELKAGPIGPLYRLALELQTDLDLRIGVESKAARGYRLYSGAPPRPVKPAAPPLEEGVSALQAIRRIVDTEIGVLLANEPAASAGLVEGVHQMRVTIRWLRAALALFQPLLDPHAAEGFNEELRQIALVLGEARDWDVFCQETLPGALSEDGGAGWQKFLVPAAEAERRAAYQRLQVLLLRSYLTRLALAMVAWTAGGPEQLGDKALEQPLIDVAPALLDRIARKALRRGRHVAELTPAALHDLRKAMKKLRYGIEFLKPLFPREAVKRVTDACEEVQEVLGRFNDAQVATALARHLSARGHPERIPAIAAIETWAEGRRQDALHRMPEAWRAVQDAEPFWQPAK